MSSLRLAIRASLEEAEKTRVSDTHLKSTTDEEQIDSGCDDGNITTAVVRVCPSDGASSFDNGGVSSNQSDSFKSEPEEPDSDDSDGSEDDASVENNCIDAAQKSSRVFVSSDSASLWGSGCFGQLALGKQCIAFTPTKVDGLSKVKRIFCGRTHNAAITHDETLYTWGCNRKGQLGRKIQETGVTFTPYPGSVDEFGTMVNRIGRGYPASVTCGDDFTLVATHPYTGPSEKEMLELAEMTRRKKLEEKEEQARIQREQEEEEKRQREIQEEKEKIYYLTSKRLCTLDQSCPGFTYDSSKPSICKECGYSVSFHTIVADDEHKHEGTGKVSEERKEEE